MTPWQLHDSQWLLRTDALTGRFDLSQPDAGLVDLEWHDQPIAGNLLAVSVADAQDKMKPLLSAHIDAYARGNDLISNFPEAAARRFALQCYWRISRAESNIVVLDAIVSMQTSLLECYPTVFLKTTVPFGTVHAVSVGELATQSLVNNFSSEEPTAVVIRGAGSSWSYFEMTHPTDLGTWRVAIDRDVKLQRQLGGEFQEKGVIRRLRVRGALLAQNEGDLEVAKQLANEFAASPPPLTA